MQSLFLENYVTIRNSLSNSKLEIFLEYLGRGDSMELR